MHKQYYLRRLSNILFLFSIALVVTMSSCEQVIDLDDPDFESRIVINSLFSSDSPWSVEVTRSYNVLETHSTNPIGNAEVHIFDQNHEHKFQLEHVGDGIYQKGDNLPSPARGYYIEVRVGDQVATAYSYVPQKSSITINALQDVADESNAGFEIDFSIEDNSNFESYFIWDIVSIDGKSTEEENLSEVFIKTLNGNHESIDFDGDVVAGGLVGNGAYNAKFNSLQFGSFESTPWQNASNASTQTTETANGSGNEVDNTNVTNEEVVGGDGGGSVDPNQPNQHKYELRVMAISKELYDFYQSLEDYDANVNSINTHLQVYSNVEGGLGLIAGYSESIVSF